MQQWTRIKEHSAADDMGAALAVDAELFRLDSVVRWLDSAEARVKRAMTDGPDSDGPHKDQMKPGRPARGPLPRLRPEMRTRR